MQIKHGEQQQFVQIYKIMLEFKSSEQWRLLQGLSSLKTVTTNKNQNKENQTTKEPSCMQHRINTICKTSYLEKDSLRLWVSHIRTVRKEDSTANENQSDYRHSS